MEKMAPRRYERIVFFTGAGMSAESGVPTCRGRSGVWSRYRWEEFACQEAFDGIPQPRRGQRRPVYRDQSRSQRDVFPLRRGDPGTGREGPAGTLCIGVPAALLSLRLPGEYT